MATSLFLGAHATAAGRSGFVCVLVGGVRPDVSPDTSPALYAAYRTAVLSGAPLVDVHAIGRAAWPTWYAAKIEPSAEMRDALKMALASVIP